MSEAEMSEERIADYYRRKEAEAEKLRREYSVAVTLGRPVEELLEIKRRLEAAEYVGD